MAPRALSSPLLPAVVDAAGPVPVVAAGGIADGRGLAAALTLGATGALLGTRFYAAAESLAHPRARPASSRPAATTPSDARLRYRAQSGLACPFTGRAIQNDFTRTWNGREAELAKASAEGPRFDAAANAAGDYDTAVLWAGEGADFVTEVEPAAQIVARIVTEAGDALASVAARLV